MKLTEQLKEWIDAYLEGTDYELVTLSVSPEDEILVEVDRLQGVDVDFCEKLNRYLVDKMDNGQWTMDNGAAPEPNKWDNYSLEVGSVSLTDPFKTKLQYEKNLGHDVEVMISTKGQSTKYKGQLVSVDEDTFSIDVEEKVAVEGKKRKELQVRTYTWRYDEPIYVKYDLKF
ncbi:MAG: hypothetical protein II551_05015 [Paludibacteraceae bacterium]|nr:hypothetical protein [Paludibacteraceae bacterium]